MRICIRSSSRTNHEPANRRRTDPNERLPSARQSALPAIVLSSDRMRADASNLGNWRLGHAQLGQATCERHERIGVHYPARTRTWNNRTKTCCVANYTTGYRPPNGGRPSLCKPLDADKRGAGTKFLTTRAVHRIDVPRRKSRNSVKLGRPECGTMSGRFRRNSFAAGSQNMGI